MSCRNRKRYENGRRGQDLPGEGHPGTWRTRLIRVAAEIVVTSRHIRVKLCGCSPLLKFYHKVPRPNQHRATIFSFARTSVAAGIRIAGPDEQIVEAVHVTALETERPELSAVSMPSSRKPVVPSSEPRLAGCGATSNVRSSRRCMCGTDAVPARNAERLQVRLKNDLGMNLRMRNPTPGTIRKNPHKCSSWPIVLKVPEAIELFYVSRRPNCPGLELPERPISA